MFFGSAVLDGAVSALTLTAAIFLGGVMTFLTSRFLSSTLLKGEPSSFTLELPPYRVPQIGRVIIRSLLDRTVFVLGRAVTAAVPAGFLIWLLGNITAGDRSLLEICAEFLDPFAVVFGMDGVIILSFILALPANEIFLPLAVMGYSGGRVLTECSSAELVAILYANGWTVSTAVCVMIFTLCHFPCAASLMTVKKESGSLKWTLLAAVVPTAVGLVMCAVVNFVFLG